MIFLIVSLFFEGRKLGYWDNRKYRLKKTSGYFDGKKW